MLKGRAPFTHGSAFFFILTVLTFLTFLTVVLFPAGDGSQNEPAGPDGTVKKLRQALNRIKPFKVSFTQQVFSDEQDGAGGGESAAPDIEESGEILFNDDRNLKWTYLTPDFKVFLLQGEDYRFYDRENEQVTVGKLKDRGRQWIWQLFFSDDILTYTRVDQPRNIIYIKKEDPQEPMNIEIHLNNEYLPVKVIQADPGTGARMVFQFEDYKEKVEIPKDAFELKVPEDVEIIRE